MVTAASWLSCSRDLRPETFDSPTASHTMSPVGGQGVNIALRDGGSVHAIDLFEIDGGRIKSLTYFIADHPSE